MERSPWVEVGRVVRRWFEIERSRRQIASLDSATRAELCLHAEADMTALARNAWRRPGQLDRVVGRLDIGGHPSLANGGFRRDLERTCALCPVVRTCDRWLVSGDREGYRAFCPNAAELSAMATGQRVAHGDRSVRI